MSETHVIGNLRKRYMSHRRVLCTGNPDESWTIASGVRRHWPDATFISRSNGYDLKTADQNQLAQLFKDHNTFINASYIGAGVQSRLLQICNQSTKFCDVFNIGSTHEYDELGPAHYRDSKLNLRQLSLSLNTFRFKTCHMIIGGIKKTNDPEYTSWLEVDEICELIKWVMAQRFNVPIISMDQPQKPW